jgi:hypothetical protein
VFTRVITINSKHPYESSKRLCELISITIHKELKQLGIHTLLMSPGNVLSSITASAVHPFVLLVALYLMRFMGCSGINITGYNAAFVGEWLANSNYEYLDAKTVYHSEINRMGSSYTREIRVDFNENDLVETLQVLKKMDQILESHC